MTKAIKPCPFCGNQHALKIITGAELMDDDQEFWPQSDSFAVICNFNHTDRGCGATGGFRTTEELAIEVWNTRSASQGEQAKPLTSHQIAELWADDIHGSFLDFARAIEVAHGIGKEQTT